MIIYVPDKINEDTRYHDDDDDDDQLKVKIMSG